MMRLETERLLAEHLINQANHENQIEKQRLLLNEHFRFHPSSAFKRLDRLNNHKLNSYDLATFLRDNGYNLYSVDLGDLIRAYDGDNDGHLDSKEIEKLLVTHTDYVLKRRTHERYEEYVGFRDRLAYEVEEQMARIIVSEVQGLKELNSEKEQLKNRYDFSRLDAFRAIDNYKINSILRDDLRTFLHRNGVEANALDVDNLFRRLDLDNDGRITYTEFCDYIDKIAANLAQPKNDFQKRQYSLNKEISQTKEFQTPNRNHQKAEFSYEKHHRNAHTEQKPHRNQQQQQQEDDEDNHESRNEIYRNYIVYGIRENNSTPLKRAQSAASFNSNSNRKDKIRFANSEDDNRLASLETTPSPTKNQSYNTPKTNNNNNNNSQNKSNNKDARRLNLDDIEEEEKENQESQNEENNNSNKQNYIQANEGDEEYASSEQNSEINNNQNKRQNHYLPPLDENEEQNLAEVLKNMIFLENDIEKSKQTLSLKADFNLLDAFRIFDTRGLGEIYKEDLEEGLKQLGLYVVSKRDLDLFFKRFDTNSDYKLRYLEFVDALTPKDKIYGDHLTNKRPNYEARHPSEAITLKTKLEFGDTMRVMLKCEGFSEELRQSLSKRQNFSISAAFQTIDTNNNGYLTKDEVKSFLENHEFFATQKEVDLLFEKMDRDRDGKVAYGEFFMEIAHKIPL